MGEYGSEHGASIRIRNRGSKKKTPDLRGYRKSVAMNRVPAHVGLIRVVTCIVGTAGGPFTASRRYTHVGLLLLFTSQADPQLI